jgi:hypothetical protein
VPRCCFWWRRKRNQKCLGERDRECEQGWEYEREESKPEWDWKESEMEQERIRKQERKQEWEQEWEREQQRQRQWENQKLWEKLQKVKLECEPALVSVRILAQAALLEVLELALGGELAPDWHKRCNKLNTTIMISNNCDTLYGNTVTILWFFLV